MKRDPRPTWLLIHSPLVGPYTWEPVAEILRGQGADVRVPELANPSEGPFWEQHVRSAVDGLDELGASEQIVLAGHSGAGVLLPAIARALASPVEAYLFVDAGLPRGGQPRMDGEFGEVLQDLYGRGERFPNWTDEDLAGILPDPNVRAKVLDGLRPQPLEFWQEPLPAILSWPDAPYGYLLFSPSYYDDAEMALRLAWPVRELPAGHFHMLVDPDAVVEQMLDLLDELGVLTDGD